MTLQARQRLGFVLSVAISLFWLSLLAGCRPDLAPAVVTRSGVKNDESERWVRSDLYFGMRKRDGTIISEADWTDFLNTSVTPRFPDGLTVVQGQGRYRSNEH